MPMRLQRRCSAPGCFQVCFAGTCAAHALRQDQWRGSPSARGYDSNWRRVRTVKLAANPLCELCGAAGGVTVATEVHHLQTIRERPDLRLTIENLQALCKPCHSAITMADLVR